MKPLLGQAAEHAEAPCPGGRESGPPGGHRRWCGAARSERAVCDPGRPPLPAFYTGSRDPETTSAAGWASRNQRPKRRRVRPGPDFGAAGARRRRGPEVRVEGRSRSGHSSAPAERRGWYGRDIVAPPGNQAANREHKHRPAAGRGRRWHRGGESPPERRDRRRTRWQTIRSGAESRR